MKSFLILLFTLISFVGFTQVSSLYSFSETTGTYTAIVGGTQLVTTTGGATSYDTDGSYFTLAAGNQFQFNNTTITSVNMTADGALILNPGTTTTGNGTTGAISSTLAATGVICGMNMDLRSTAIASQVYERRWQDVGTEVVFQWQNAARYLQSGSERFSFQIRVNKSNGQIRIVYGNMTTITTSTTYQPMVGLRGSANTDYNNRRLTNSVPDATPNWGAPNGTTAGTSNAHTVRFRDNCKPTSGLIFIWTIPTCSGTPNAGTVSASVNNACSSTSTTLTASSLSGGNGITYKWQSSTNNSTWSDIVGQTSTTYTTTLPLGSMYYRIVTTCSNSSLSNNSPAITLTGLSCIIVPGNSTTLTNTGCSGTVYDPGGTGNYSNNQTGTLTLYPTVSTDKVRLTFTSFSTESGYDGLVIHNGNSTSAPIISSGLGVGASSTNCPAGSYYGTTSPGTVTSTAADGSLTLVFRSDGSTVSTGFVATLSCFTPPAPGCATLTSPSDGSTGVTLLPTLTWSSVQYAESYDVYLGTTLPGEPTANVTSTSYTSSSLSPLTTYQWKIVPKNASGSAVGCSTWSFTTVSPEYATSWISMSTGSSNWCVNETRSVTVTVKNNGSSAWDDGVADFNLGIKWNGDADYFTRVDVQNLAAGATQTFTLTITAPSSSGSNNLTFDVVRESCFWFASNTTACGVTAGPGNVTYTSPTITINDYPTLPNG